MPDAATTGARDTYTVSGLATALKNTLEHGFPSVWVEGELSNFKAYPSGHWYFTLKDEHAQLSCVMFRGSNLRMQTRPQDGDQLLLRGRVSIYPPRGGLQLICDHLEAAGLGALQRAFERLKQRLEAEGLFDPAQRRPLPVRPGRIGVITSSAGAALHDILNTLRRRWPLAEVFLWPTPVQGSAAAPAIVQALVDLPRRAPVEVVILARGGGSLEDLWAFNEETVARAIRACVVPVVTGVGHETDFTIADFAADLRAPTPTGAAERVSPEAAELRTQLEKLERALCRTAVERTALARHVLAALRERLQRQHPARALQRKAQQLDELSARLARQNPHRVLRNQRLRLDQALGRLHAATLHRLAILRQHAATHPPHLDARRLRASITARRDRVGMLRHRLHLGMHRRLEARGQQLARADLTLHMLDPRAVLKRGYAWTTDADGHVLTDARALAAGQHVRVHLYRGGFDAEVRDILPATASPDTD